MSEWIKVSDRLPEDGDELVLFVNWQRKWGTFLETYAGKWEDVQNFREHDLKYNYTHWQALTKPNK